MSVAEPTESKYGPPVEQLLTYGDGQEISESHDYLALGFTADHIPELICMATDDTLLWAKMSSLEVWAPLHAWRVLGQLRAEAAIEPLIGLLHFVDDADENWIDTEIPNVLGAIGAAAIPPLTAYLADDAHGLYARGAAVGSLEKIASQHPEHRDVCVGALTAQLARYDTNGEELNGHIICSLMDLKAVESASTMEQAFAAETVDLSIGGDWEDVQVELGLLEERTTPRSRLLWLPALGGSSARKRPAPGRSKSQKQKKKKSQKAARKKNRKR